MNIHKQQLLARLAAATLVPLTIDDKTFMADANSFAKEDRTVLHGEFMGTKVESPAILEIQGNVIVWPEEDETPASSFTPAGLGVLAVGYLKSKGHTVSAPI
jgi:hypothetical protein